MGGRIWLAASVAFGLATSVCAQDYATRPVKIVVPTGAGTIADTVTRMMAQDLSNQFSQTFIVDNRVGANGVIGAGYVASSAPDGTTLIVGNVSTHAANEFMYAKLPYDPEKDFTPVALVGTVPHVVVVAADMPVKTYSEFVKWAKERPGKLNFASGSSLTIVAMEVIKRGAGIDALHVPFRATPQAATEMLAGRVDVMVTDFGVAKPFIDSGKMRPILVTMSERSPLLPGIPCLPEVGLPKLDIVGWFGWFAPKNSPQEAINRIYEGLRRATANKEYQDKLAVVGVSLTASGPRELEHFRLEQRAMYQTLVKEAGLKAE